MKILISGHLGNLGSHITQHEGHEFVGIHRTDWENLDNTLEKGFDAVIHCAYDLKNSIQIDPDTVFESNLISTTKLLKGMKKYPPKHFIFLSSCAVYGNSSNTKEDIATMPESINGMTKKLNEDLIKEFCSKNELPYNILRVFNLYGGNDHFSVLSYLEKAIKGTGEFYLNNGGLSQRDFIHVEDVAKVALRILDSELKSEIVNVGTGKATKVSELFEIAKSYFPDIEVNHSSHREVEYSRANTEKLSSFMTPDFIDVKGYMHQLCKKLLKNEK